MIIDQVPAVKDACKGKVIVITGAGRGIGREAARILARLGAAVVVAEVQAETGQATAELIRAAGGEALFIHTDVSDEASVAHLHDQVMAAYGKVDMLVNNATAFTFGPLVGQSAAQWDRVMGVNLRGAFLCVRAFLPQMLARRCGVICTMESSEGMPYLAPYLASKVGLRSLAASLAMEVGEGSGVSVFCFGPGMVDTPGLAEALEKLPPLYGMNREEFIRHSGVNLVSAEVCATGLAGTLLYAGEFHGQQAFFTQGLGKLGLNVAGELQGEAPGAAFAETAASASTATGVSGLAAALALNEKLEGILRDHIREYNELTLFQRPIVKRMFQQGTGLKVEEWLERAHWMTRQLRALADGTVGWAPGEPAAYVAQLQRLAQYIRKQEGDARGYFKNQADLDRALQALHDRHAVVAGLVAALETK
ncbi:MAG TPA: SDR family oxidoreductase [Symbiobacteriaceae bacterium]|nr:SDR family oxidoreductase [Symbiobacteriaceae bacterium]